MDWMGQGYPREVQLLYSKYFAWYVLWVYVSVLKDNLQHLFRVLWCEQNTSSSGDFVPSLCLILCVWCFQRWFGDHEFKLMWCFSYTKLCFGRVVICSKSRAGCCLCLRKMQLPKSSSASPQIHILEWCTLIIQLHTFLFFLALRLSKKFCEFFSGI